MGIETKIKSRVSETEIRQKTLFLAAILKFKMAVWTKLANAFFIVLIEFLDP